MLRSPSYIRRPSLAIALSAILLSGCAAPRADYPTLAIRDAERVEGSFSADTPVPNPPAEIPLNLEMTERLILLQASAALAHRTFLNAVPSAGQLVDAASGAGAESNRWASAQIALADLDSARSQTAIPLADLDMLHADAALTLEQRRDIINARNAVTGMIAEQDAVLSTLHGKMPS